jgi:hypothetical protein
MAKIRTDTININAGVSTQGVPRPITMPVEVHDDSGVNNDALFNGTITPPTVDPAQSNWSPKDMNTQPKPPRGRGE